MISYRWIRFSLVFPLLIIVLVSATANGQRREHLTPAEIELVRDIQDVDGRMELFVNAIERRLWVIDGKESLTDEQAKKLKKDHDKWGELPTGTKSELLSDIEKILNEAIDKLEDVYDREPKNELIPYALYIIADYSEALIPKLTNIADKTTDTRDLGLLQSAANHCQNIMSARENVPRPTTKKKKKRKKTK